MDPIAVPDSVVVVTGGGSGIGAALARRFHAEGARSVVVVDRDADKAAAVAAEVGGVAESVDVTDAAAVAALVERTIARDGAIDVFCSNAGITTGVGLDDPDDLWHAAFDVHVMAQVYAARAVVPHMLERGRGWLINTASAAGLLISPSDAPYTATKHASVGFAEWLAVTYGSRGIGVSVLCPLGVATPLLMGPLAEGEPGARQSRPPARSSRPNSSPTASWTASRSRGSYCCHIRRSVSSTARRHRTPTAGWPACVGSSIPSDRRQPHHHCASTQHDSTSTQHDSTSTERKSATCPE